MLVIIKRIYCKLLSSNKHKNIVNKLFKMLKQPDQVQLQFNECKLKTLKNAAELYIRFSKLYLPTLRSISQPSGSEKNTFPWITIKVGFYYLGNAYDLVQIYKDCVPGSIDNEDIQSVNNMLIALEFYRKHIIGYTDEANGAMAEYFISKEQGRKYYKLLHSELKRDVRSFIEMVELNIDIPVKRFLESIEQRLRFVKNWEKLFKAIENDNLLTVEYCIEKGVGVNFKDTDGRTPLHHAVNNGNVYIVSTLLKNGADVTQITNEGNTPLHIASSKGYRKVVEVLLQYVSRDKLNDFIDAKTTSGDTTSLHIAAKNSFLETVESLLQHGAIYDIEDKEGKIPIDLSKDRKVTNLLKLIEEFFRNTKKSNDQIISKLRAVKYDEFLSITNARNIQGNTLLQVAIANKQKNIVRYLKTKLVNGEVEKRMPATDDRRDQP